MERLMDTRDAMREQGWEVLPLCLTVSVCVSFWSVYLFRGSGAHSVFARKRSGLSGIVTSTCDVGVSEFWGGKADRVRRLQDPLLRRVQPQTRAHVTPSFFPVKLGSPVWLARALSFFKIDVFVPPIPYVNLSVVGELATSLCQSDCRLQTGYRGFVRI